MSLRIVILCRIFSRVGGGLRWRERTWHWIGAVYGIWKGIVDYTVLEDEVECLVRMI